MLDTIVTRIRSELPELVATQAELQNLAAAAPSVRDFVSALTAPGLSVIAEVKRRSPSRGVIDADLDPSLQAQRYQQGGAAAISVLTERHHFHGSPADLTAVRERVDCPVLRKDFLVHPVQVAEARAMGADAVLLIVSILDDGMLRKLLDEVHGYGMTPLVEVHSRDEVNRALDAGASAVGVNNRDLSTFEVDLATAERLADAIPEATVRVAESGIWTKQDAARMQRAGYDAVLVGEALVRDARPEALVRELRQLP